LRFQQVMIHALVASLASPVISALAADPAPQAGAPKQQLVSQAGTLKITVVEGEGAKNNIRSRTAVSPVVEVKDTTDKPVVGAEVVFQLPMLGPSGVFNGWLKTQTVRTDEQGRALVTGYTPNTESGRFNIKVTATAGTQTGTVVIAQSNVVNGSGGSVSNGVNRSRTWKILAVVGGAAIAGGVVAATRGDDTPAATAVTNPVTITAGGVSVGNPR